MTRWPRPASDAQAERCIRDHSVIRSATDSLHADVARSEHMKSTAVVAAAARNPFCGKDNSLTITDAPQFSASSHAGDLLTQFC